ncbi:MAG: hypothetical protein QW299_09640, partial [Candidatus Caldarchaeum sp.]
VIWLQTLPAFGLWIAFIVIRRHWMRGCRSRFANISRPVRIGWMLFALIGSLAILFAGIAGIAGAGWMTKEGLSVFGMVAVAAVGLVFIHLQMIATALTLSLAVDRVTPTEVPTSNPQNSSGDPT